MALTALLSGGAMLLAFPGQSVAQQENGERGQSLRERAERWGERRGEGRGERRGRRDAPPASDEIRLQVDGRERTYRLFIPESRRGTGPMPLIVVLHGTFGDGAKMQSGLGFDPHARRLGFAVAYPDAYTPPGSRSTWRWNDGRGTLRSSQEGVDDVAFLRALVTDAAGRTSIDTDRVFVTGASNGGIMAYRAACEAPDLFRGAAPVIGNVAEPIANSCRPSRPIDILAINGVADPWVPYAGGEVCDGAPRRLCEGGPVISATRSAGIFASAAGCQAAPTSTRRPPQVDDGTSVEEIRWSGCRGRSNAASGRIVLLAVHGGGHAWPPNTPQGGEERFGKGSQNLDATAEIVDFFLAPSRNQPRRPRGG